MIIKKIEKDFKYIQFEYQNLKEILKKDKLTNEEEKRCIKYIKDVREIKKELYNYDSVDLEFEKENLVELLCLALDLEEKFKFDKL